MRARRHHAWMALLLPCIAGANGHLVPMARSAEWVALEHRIAGTGTADICAAVNMPAGLALLSDRGQLQLRVVSNALYVPAGVPITLVVSVGDWQRSFAIHDATANMVNAELSEEAASALLQKMDLASGMTVAAGSAPAIHISLPAGTNVTNAFRACAGLGGTTLLAGGNPAQGSRTPGNGAAGPPPRQTSGEITDVAAAWLPSRPPPSAYFPHAPSDPSHYTHK